MPKIARIASVVAFAVAGLAIISALTQEIILLPFALIPLMAGIGIMRKRVWSAYGFSLYSFAQVLLLLLPRSRSTATSAQIIVAGVLAAAMAAFFLFAGRALAAAGSKRGAAWPWIAVSALITLPFLFVQAFVIPTGSMQNTLLIGDRVLVQRFPKTKPVLGDIVVFAYPIDRTQTSVKRVIGLPGDRIRILDKIVFRNGTALQEPYVVHNASYPDSYRDNLPSKSNVFVGGQDAAQEMLNKHVVNGEIVLPEGIFRSRGQSRQFVR